MIDLRPLESQRNGRGYVLRCPRCGDWSRGLLIRDTGELLCRSCWRVLGSETIERYGVEQHLTEVR